MQRTREIVQPNMGDSLPNRPLTCLNVRVQNFDSLNVRVQNFDNTLTIL